MGSLFGMAYDVKRALTVALVSGKIYGSNSKNQDEWPVVEASIIRDFLRGVDSDIHPDPRGLILSHVHVVGRLDLDQVETDIALVLHDCTIPEGITAQHARLPGLSVLNTKVPYSSQKQATVNLMGAVLGFVKLGGTKLVNSEGPAIIADGVQIGGNMLLNDGFTAESESADGAVRLLGAAIGGQLNMDGARLTNKGSGPALIADTMHVGGNMVLSKDSIATGNSKNAMVRLVGANIAGQLSMRGTSLANNGPGPALAADAIRVGGDMFLREKFTAKSEGTDGTVRLLGAAIGGQLAMDGACLTNNGAGTALMADTVRVGSNMVLSKDFIATGNGEDGTVRLVGANITGQLAMTGASLANEGAGPALIADTIRVGGHMLLREKFTAKSEGTDGTIRLQEANISGQLTMRGAQLTNTKGPALIADTIRVGGNMVLSKDFIATGNGEDGTVRLVGANVSGQLTMRGAQLTNTKGPALCAIRMTIGQDLLMDLLPGNRPTPPGIYLTDTSIEGRLKISAASLPPQLKDIDVKDVSKNSDVQGKWDVNGLTYRALDGVTSMEWMGLLAHGTRSYAPQPYQQLAAAARSEGHEDVVRRALIAQHDDQLDRSSTEDDLLTPGERCKKQLLKYTVGYGYRPWLALGWLLGILGIAVLIMYILWFPASALAILDPETQQCSGICKQVDLWILASEVVPLLQGFDTQCSPIIWREAFFLIISFLKLAAWAMLTLFIAGFTQIVRKPVA